MGDSARKSCSTNSGVCTRNDEADLSSITKSLRKPDVHCFTKHSAKTRANFESRDESPCWHREGQGQNGEGEGGEDIAGKRDEDALSVGILPVFDVVIFIHT